MRCLVGYEAQASISIRSERSAAEEHVLTGREGGGTQRRCECVGVLVRVHADIGQVAAEETLQSRTRRCWQRAAGRPLLLQLLIQLRWPISGACTLGDESL